MKPASCGLFHIALWKIPNGGITTPRCLPRMPIASCEPARKLRRRAGRKRSRTRRGQAAPPLSPLARRRQTGKVKHAVAHEWRNRGAPVFFVCDASPPHPTKKFACVINALHPYAAAAQALWTHAHPAWRSTLHASSGSRVTMRASLFRPARARKKSRAITRRNDAAIARAAWFQARRKCRFARR